MGNDLSESPSVEKLRVVEINWGLAPDRLQGGCATQPTVPAGLTSTKTVLYVDSVPPQKELASTSFGHKRAFSSLSSQ